MLLYINKFRLVRHLNICNPAVADATIITPKNNTTKVRLIFMILCFYVTRIMYSTVIIYEKAKNIFIIFSYEIFWQELRKFIRIIPNPFTIKYQHMYFRTKSTKLEWKFIHILLGDLNFYSSFKTLNDIICKCTKILLYCTQSCNYEITY